MNFLCVKSKTIVLELSEFGPKQFNISITLEKNMCCQVCDFAFFISRIFIEFFVRYMFPREYIPTIFDIVAHDFSLNGSYLCLDLYDTVGLEGIMFINILPGHIYMSF